MSFYYTTVILLSTKAALGIQTERVDEQMFNSVHLSLMSVQTNTFAFVNGFHYRNTILQKLGKERPSLV